jgi:hypothetical protein
MSKHRAILIDPEQRTFTEVKIGRGIKPIQRLLHCQSFTTGARSFNGSLKEGFDTLYVSDDCLEDRDNPRFWFQVDADRNPPSSFPIAGYGLAMGVNDRGEACDLRIGIAELKSRITFTRRKFRGFEVKEYAGEGLPHIQVDVIAPIVDK